MDFTISELRMSNRLKQAIIENFGPDILVSEIAEKPWSELFAIRKLRLSDLVALWEYCELAGIPTDSSWAEHFET